MYRYLLLMPFLAYTHLHAQDFRNKKRIKAEISKQETFKTESISSESTNIQGIILDSHTREYLQGVRVFLEGTNYGTLTGFDGSFYFSHIPPGDYVLHISYIGYEAIQQPIQVKENQTLSLSNIALEESAIGIQEVKIIASTAKEQVTPVALSQYNLKQLQTQPGYQEFPTLISKSPSIFSSRRGGAFGDSRVSVRGFDQSNIAVLVNGIPVNDMADGKVYWSNWGSLKEVTRAIQVQRGMGASRLSIGSVGGTINILTKTSEAEKFQQIGVSYSSEFKGFKYQVSGSTGRMKNGLSISFSGSFLHGKGYVQATDMQAGSYFLSATQELGGKHLLMLTLIGSPQIHGQKETPDTLATLATRGHFYNPDFGFHGNEAKNVRTNFYHKPLMGLTHVFSINPRTTLSSTLYASWGRGYGSGSVGSLSRTSDGYVNWDKIYATNATRDTSFIASNGELVSGKASATILRNAYNNHNWYGILSILSHKLTDKIQLHTGLDARTYKGMNYRTVSDLLGGDFYIDKTDINHPNRAAKIGDKIAYDVVSYISWVGGFAETTYESDEISAYASVSAAETFYKRRDFFNYTPEKQLSESKSAFGYTIKGGLNYHILKSLNIFGNAGFYSRAPFMNFVFVNGKNDLAQNARNEKIQSYELGAAFVQDFFRLKVNVYHTYWQDKFYLSKKITNSDGSQTSARINGINALHKGLEFDADFILMKKLNIGFYGGIGDWRWKNNVATEILNDQGQTVENVKLYLNNLKVAEAPQTNLGISVQYSPIPKLNIGVDYTYYDQIYTSFDFTTRSIATDSQQPYRLPAYGLLNAFANYTLEIKKIELLFSLSAQNLANAAYLSEGIDGTMHTRNAAQVFYGFGRTFAAGISFTFR